MHEVPRGGSPIHVIPSVAKDLVPVAALSRGPTKMVGIGYLVEVFLCGEPDDAALLAVTLSPVGVLWDDHDDDAEQEMAIDSAVQQIVF
jgi:hypothetical protein